MEDRVIRVQSLQVQFETDQHIVQAVSECSFDLKKAQTLAIVGESGSGKSVTALAIMGLLNSPPAQITGGKILFCKENAISKNLLQLSEKEYQALRGKELAMIFQEPMTSLNPLMRCGEQVAESIRLHLGSGKEEARLKTIALFQEVKLRDAELCYKKYPHELSGGQKQRVMIAMALCANPSVLIADEPTTALDVQVQKSILELIREVSIQRNLAVLFITHDLDLVRSFADEVVVMYKGKIEEQGAVKKILEHPESEYTRALLQCKPRGSVRVKYLPTLHTSSGDPQPTNSIRDPLDKNTRPLLELHEIQIAYPQRKNLIGQVLQWKQVVNGFSLKIQEGSTHSLLGESGSGKTSIGKAIVRLVPIQEGKILFQGKNIELLKGDDLMDYRRDVQMIFQDPYSSLNPRIEIGKAIREPLDVHGIGTVAERKEKVIQLLQKTGLDASFYHRYPHEFSGGQRQRICIARSLILQPRLLICDESVSALDVSVQAQILNLLVQLKDEFGLSYLFITHDIAVARHLSDRITIMREGKKVEENDTDTLFLHPEHEYSRQLLESVH
ncbi:MAG TPA: ABC transporter ATP-binding protein [Chitinophagaceae bacterium]|nr:ABC transporter ATP-binding protein [Chitinophagaceae bacterium]